MKSMRPAIYVPSKLQVIVKLQIIEVNNCEGLSQKLLLNQKGDFVLTTYKLSGKKHSRISSLVQKWQHEKMSFLKVRNTEFLLESLGHFKRKTVPWSGLTQHKLRAQYQTVKLHLQAASGVGLMGTGTYVSSLWLS